MMCRRQTVLPKTEAERDTDNDQGDDQPRPQLVEMIDERQLLIMTNAAQRSAERLLGELQSIKTTG